MRTVFFHEDDYGMVQLLPAAARERCLAEMRQIESEVAASSSEFGFTDLHVLSEPSPSFRSLGLAEAELAAVLEPLLPRFAEVYTGYSSHRESCPGLRAWGFDDHQALFAQVSPDGEVGEVWFDLSDVGPPAVRRWVQVLQSLPGAADLLLVDWFRHEVVPLADGQRLTAYLMGEK
jgi:hypothetical protein